ncbi:MAG: hydrogenase nickel incorporation protein HypB [Erysipelotrichaceae bacterium]|nr:hydrogenase nickel incorporation protein HypB [Erysipelotrichaceae bacterium]
MDKIKIIEVKESVFASNDRRAEELRQQLKEKGTFLLNVMSSPGSGKTTVLTGIINELKNEFRIAVMEADIDSDVDARTVSKNTGVEAIQLHTGGMCHLDADMTRQGIEALNDKDNYDLIILENVGNLVCPAEFDTGAVRNMCILSVPEGDDKPLKYPLMFEIANFVLINKIDVLDYFDFDIDKCKENIRYRNPMADIFEVCGKDLRGIKEVSDYLRGLIYDWRN